MQIEQTSLKDTRYPGFRPGMRALMLNSIRGAAVGSEPRPF